MELCIFPHHVENIVGKQEVGRWREADEGDEECWQGQVPSSGGPEVVLVPPPLGLAGTPVSSQMSCHVCTSPD